MDLVKLILVIQGLGVNYILLKQPAKGKRYQFGAIIDIKVILKISSLGKLVRLVGIRIATELYTLVLATVAIREEQYIIQRYISGVSQANMVVTQGLARRPTVSKNNITVAGIFILIRNNDSNLISRRQIFIALISPYFKNQLYLRVKNNP